MEQNFNNMTKLTSKTWYKASLLKWKPTHPPNPSTPHPPKKQKQTNPKLKKQCSYRAGLTKWKKFKIFQNIVFSFQSCVSILKM